MDIILWIILTICAVFFTVLSITLKDYPDIRGFSLVLAIISLISWIVAGFAAIDLTTTYVVLEGTTIYEYTTHYVNTWPITFFYILASIFPLLLILKQIPEVWPGAENA